MTNLRMMVLGIAALLFVSSVHAAAPTPERDTTRIARFDAEVIDVSGNDPRTARFDSRDTDRITAYVILGTKCPTSNSYAERFGRLEREYQVKGVDFIYVYPNREDTRDKKISFHRTKALGGRLIDDQGGRIARLLGAQRTSEVILADQQGRVVYRGALDDNVDAARVKRPFLAMALDETLAGKAVSIPFSQVFA